MRIILVLSSIIIVAAILRLIALDQYPAGLNADEASIGYNAYSLLLTGKDEYGTPWPLQFKSFGDYKPGLYFYIVLPFVSFLGLNEWAVRVPSSLFGTATVVLIYFLAKEIFQNRQVALLSAFLLAVSPWHLHFSKGAWETNVATFFLSLGVLLFIKGLRNPLILFWSALSFLASMYTYQSPRLIVPVLLLMLLFLYQKNFKGVFQNLVLKMRWRLFFGTLFLLILLIPLFWQFIKGEGGARFAGLAFVSDPGPILRVNELRGEHSNLKGVEAILLHNKLTAYGPNFLGHYLDHFKPDFLFINGDPIIRNKVPEMGQFYLIGSYFLIFGAVALARLKFKYSKLLIAWILVAPLASSVTFQTPHALRALNMVIPLTLVAGYGFWIIVNLFKSYWRIVIIGVLGLILIFEFIRYLESYYIHYPKRYPQAFEYGFKEMVAKLGSFEPYYNKVVITDRYDQPYILVLFYKKYDPNKFQPQAILSPRDKFHFGTVRSFDKYEFRKINPAEIPKSQGTLFVATQEEISENTKILDQVEFPNGKPAFLFVRGE